MSGYLDHHVDVGTHYRFSFLWGVETDGEFTPYDLAGAAVSTTVGTASIVGDTIEVEFTPTVTSVEGTTELLIHVTFPDGDTRMPLRGKVVVR